MTNDQVRWKMNALLKKYKEVIDNFSKSGRGNIEFEWFEQMDDIFGKKKDATNENYTVSSKVCATIDKADPQFGKRQTSTSQFGKKRTLYSSCSSSSQNVEKENYDESSNKVPKHTDIAPSVSNTSSKQKSSPRGTGSTIAKTKVELEKQWLHHLTIKE